MVITITVIATHLLMPASPILAAEPGSWEHYKEIFISGDGRVIDHYQDKCSHSEGQGYGMILAVRFNDPDTFDRLFRWTTANLMVRQDGLAAWKWGERGNGSWGVIDYNNATDGDILIAWACLLAGEKWKKTETTAFAKTLLNRIKSLLVMEIDGLKLLLPGHFGFDTQNHVRINPGYLVFPAFETFADVDDPDFWKRLTRDSLTLLENSRFTRFHLPADWVIVDKKGRVTMGNRPDATFQYEAIRVPLYLSWSSHKKELQGFSRYIDFCGKMGYLPQSVNLFDETISMREAPGGFYAVMGEAARWIGRPDLSRKWKAEAIKRVKAQQDNYYTTTLYLLAETGDTP